MRTVNVRPWRKRRKLGQELRGIAIRSVGVAICLVLCELVDNGQLACTLRTGGSGKDVSHSGQDSVKPL